MDQNKLTRTKTQPHLFLFFCCLALLPGIATAQDTITYHVGTSVVHDDNLFRIPDGISEAQVIDRIGDDDTSDTITQVEAGVTLDLPISRQRLLLGANINRNEFDRFDALDYTGGDAAAELQWELGRRWFGDMGYSYDRRLNGFSQSQALLRDIREQQLAYLSANYRLAPRWQLFGGLESDDLELDERDQIDRRVNSAEFGARYTSRADNYVELGTRYADADYSNPELINGVLVDNNYDQSEVNAELDYRFSASRINFRLGYLDRSHDDFAGRDFSGSTGRLTFDWDLTGKTSFSFSAFRLVTTFSDLTFIGIGDDIIAEEDLVSNFVLIEGVSFSPTWTPTAKIAVQGRFSYEDRSFGGDPDIQTGGDEREDEVRSASLSLGYLPTRNIALSLTYLNLERDSTAAFGDYETDRISAEVRLEF